MRQQRILCFTEVQINAELKVSNGTELKCMRGMLASQTDTCSFEQV
jgi:hypothetical protein